MRVQNLLLRGQIAAAAAHPGLALGDELVGRGRWGHWRGLGRRRQRRRGRLLLGDGGHGDGNERDKQQGSFHEHLRAVRGNRLGERLAVRRRLR